MRQHGILLKTELANDVPQILGRVQLQQVISVPGSFSSEKKKCNRGSEGICNFGQLAATDSVGARFILLDLLKRHPKLFSQQRLGH